MHTHAPARPPRHARGHAALRRHRASLAGQTYHLTSATAFRRRLFTQFEAASAAAGAFASACRSGGAELVAWVLMPDHAHWLVELGEGAVLSDVANRLKSASARAVNAATGCAGRQVWAPGYHDHALRRDESVRGVAAYIVANPVRAGLVASPLEWPYWDARWIEPGGEWMP